MERLVKKYVEKLAVQGLASPADILMGGLDAEYYWSRSDPDIEPLTRVFEGLNINSLLVGRPLSPYGEIIDYLRDTCDGAVYPRDSETRTFLHDLPIAGSSCADEILYYLKRRKCVLLPGGRIASFGTVSPEEAFINFSSACFACYVKFMSDCLERSRSNSSAGSLDPGAKRILGMALEALRYPPVEIPPVVAGPFRDESAVCQGIAEVGRVTVEYGLVDSHFGNVSCLLDDVLYISQTGASLEELSGCIDPCPLDGRSSAGITASSELTAHRRILEVTGASTVLHGHPKFSAIMSLDCTETDCADRGQCHIRCNRSRFVGDVPIVPGEVGTGPFGLCNTVPEAMKGRRGVIVYGHGLFTTGAVDFQDALAHLFDIERMCIEAFVDKIG